MLEVLIPHKVAHITSAGLHVFAYASMPEGVKIYKALRETVPLRWYGSEKWIMNRAERTIIEAVKIKFLRNVSGHAHKVQVSKINIQ
jgi:hypothetical protein